MKTKLLIFPFNGNGLEALGCLSDDFEFIGFVDDEIKKQGKQNLGFTVFSRKAIDNYPAAKILAVPGSPTTFLKRRQIIEDLKILPARFATIIHKNAYISPLAKIGRNVLLMAGVVVTSNAVIGDNVCILPNTVIHHDVTIGNEVLIGSNVTIAGYSKIGDNCYIGSGSRIINNIRIGNRVLVGMGSNVIKPVRNNFKVAGNPAKPI